MVLFFLQELEPESYPEKQKARVYGLFRVKPGIATQVEKDDPQPQVVVALGLRITNCEPSRPSV